jgi:fibronectin type 3 domain-containing protein
MKRNNLIMAGALAALLVSVFFLTGCGNRKLADLTSPELEEYYKKKNKPYAKPHPKLNTPNGVTAETLTSTSIQISWEAVPGAESYKIYVPSTKSSSKDFVWKSTVMTNSYIDSTVKASQTCFYKVSAVNKAGESAQSASVSAKTPDPLGKPNSVTAAHSDYPARPNSSKTSIKITWAAVSGAVSYNVYLSTGSGWQYVGSTTEAGWTHACLQPDSYYRYMVRAVDSGGTEGANSTDYESAIGKTAG